MLYHSEDSLYLFPVILGWHNDHSLNHIKSKLTTFSDLPCFPGSLVSGICMFDYLILSQLLHFFLKLFGDMDDVILTLFFPPDQNISFLPLRNFYAIRIKRHSKWTKVGFLFKNICQKSFDIYSIKQYLDWLNTSVFFSLCSFYFFKKTK